MREQEDMGLWTDTLEGYPCGILRCTYEPHPKAVYANEWMLRLLGTELDSADWRDFFRRDIFFMLPFEERGLFRGYLAAATEDGRPVSLEHRVVSCTGGCTRLAGNLTLAHNTEGDLEYQFLYLQLPDASQLPWQVRGEPYRRLLKQSYDIIFQIDHRENTLECIHYEKELLHAWYIGQTRLVFSEGLMQSFLACVHEEDRARVQDWMTEILSPRQTARSEGDIRFRLRHGSRLWEYQGAALCLDSRTSFLCGRDVTGESGAALERAEMEWLHSMQTCIEALKNGQMPVGMVFRLKDSLVYPVSSITNICRFCDMSQEEYLWARDRGVPVETFLHQCRVTQSEFWKALRSGEVQLEERDREVIQRQLHISQADPAPDGSETYTLLLIYTLADEPLAVQTEKPRVRISTFGHFDVFVDDKPVVFRNEKSKEMLAVLTDRCGGFVNNVYMISCLWENEPYNERTQSRCRQTTHRLMETLRQYGIEDILEKSGTRRRIVPERVSCDLFHHKQGLKIPGELFNGIYMADYSWGEVTLSGLLKQEEETGHNG